MRFSDRVIRFLRNPWPAIRRRLAGPIHRIEVIKGNRKTKLTDECLQACPPENNESFLGQDTDIKVIALYLPQFHEFEENNRWWGDGFTEWTNVRKSNARFDGHTQPRAPHGDFGYYDLSTEDAVRKQVALAKQHGIYAFGMYYYWFSGHRLMEKPMDILLENQDLDIPYFAIWANENFTRAWDGQARDILLEQEYSAEDPAAFIDSLKKYIDDERYMRVDGKPIIGIYNPSAIPHAADVFTAWRDHARKTGIGEIQIWACITEGSHEGLDFHHLVDHEYEFPPRGKLYVDGEFTPDEGYAFNYITLVESARRFPIEPLDTLHPSFRGTMLEWDNSARRKTKYAMWKNYSPFRFYVWNRISIGYLRANYDPDQRYLFVNAWNEWGEGTYLEPDEKYGYANINALSKAAFDAPYSDNHSELVEYMGAYREPDAPSTRLVSIPKVAVQAHMYYDDLADELREYLKNIPCDFDLYITTDSEEKASALEERFSGMPRVSALKVSAVGNVGRDVLPFLDQMRDVASDYDIIGHIHTKKTLHGEYGNSWRKYLLQNLLGSKELVTDIFNAFLADERIGLVFPQPFYVVKRQVEWGSNMDIAERALEQLELDIALPDDILFPVGNMLWFRPEAVHQLFALNTSDFHAPEDDGKVDGTIMHTIERLWIYIAKANGFRLLLTRNLLDDFPLEELRDDEC